MKVFVSLLALAVAATTVDTKSIHCSMNSEDRQEIDFDDLKYSEDRNAYETSDVARKLRIVLTISKKYPVYAEEAGKNGKFSDPLNLVDVTESLPNGYIEYKNAMVSGVGNSVLKEVNFDRIENNKFSVFAVLSGADVNGDYIAGTSDGLLHSGQFQITLTDCEFRARLGFDQFPELRPEIGSGSIACGRHGSSYSNDGPLERLATARGESGAAAPAFPRPYHRDYLNGTIKSRLAEEMIVRLAPSIARRLERKFAAAVLFPADAMPVPETRAYIAPGIQAKIYDTQLEDLTNTMTVQKLVSYTTVGGATEMLFSFGAFDLTGSTGWTLAYGAEAKAYNGRATFTVDNLQATIVARKPDGRGGKTTVKFAVTTVNGLAMTTMGAGDQMCESIVNLAGQRVPKVLERSLEAYVGRYFESVLRNQMAIVGEQDQ